MFDFAFSEIALIGVVALVVIGPERLPRVARTAGVVVGRLQRYAATVKADIAREVELSELRRVHGEIKDAAQALESGVRESLASAETHLAESREALMSGPQPGAAALAGEEAAASLDRALATGAQLDHGRFSARPLPESPAPVEAAVATPAASQATLFSAAEAPPGNGSEHPPLPPAAAPEAAPPGTARPS